MLTILVFEIKEGKNAQKINKLLTIIYYLVVEKLTFRLCICYSSLVCLYKFRKKGLFLGGGANCDFVGGTKVELTGWGHSAPYVVVRVYKHTLITLY